ncbi:GNAT family N-acetyltransferase [Nesterenkonia sp. MY13]|uniref:GNAT family N-acetyltransferase n=1 Tax=Nesterenkonia sedimenti TaxID=1463632 RepID=A0A7X8TJL4_9MICC|nr:GNAT family N-acetyltransferase [Nesterenkonia sedimenti]NLS09766.1 GNAT family N-acetyltransferase [Nesterenkonia sedimenti]
MLTSRLRLRAPDEGDIDFVVDMYSRYEVVRYIGRGEVQTTREEAAERIQRYRSQFGPSAGVWLIEEQNTDDDAAVGFALLKPIPFSEGIEGEQDVEIGWHLHPRAWGKGYASEAAQALVDHARAQGLKQLVAVTHADNAASQAVAARLGMTHQDSTDRYYNTTCELFTLDL